MTKPLALFLYEKLLPGGQLVNRLQDLGYRVQPLSDPKMLADLAQCEKPILVLADLEPERNAVCEAIAQLRDNEVTSHIPLIAFASPRNANLQAAARTAGATLVVSDNAILLHLNQLLEQALQVD